MVAGKFCRIRVIFMGLILKFGLYTTCLNFQALVTCLSNLKIGEKIKSYFGYHYAMQGGGLGG